MKLATGLRPRSAQLIKLIATAAVVLFVSSTFVGLILFVNFYSYSSLTRLVYSAEWLLAYTPLVAPDGGIVVPSLVSMAFHRLHALKMAYTRFSSKYLYGDDGYPDFAGKYHWTRGELEACRARRFEMLDGRGEDPRLLCYVDASLLRFLKSEVLSVDPPLVKYHSFLPSPMVADLIHESEQLKLTPSRILVEDSLGADIWQDSLVVNGTAMSRTHSPATLRLFLYAQSRISAFNLAMAEQFNLKKYLPGGHYAPHLDYVINNPYDAVFGNRIATLMFILRPADSGGGTVFPSAGVNFVPEAGDALIWLNQQPDYSVAHNSFHGACPVLAGEKISLTLWVRSVGQELRLPCPLEKGAPFGHKLLTHPDYSRPGHFWTHRQCSLDSTLDAECKPANGKIRYWT